MMLQERQEQVHQMKEALSLSVSGKGSVVAISGEAGLGKTCLVRYFLSELDPAIRILRGACENLSVAEPLGPLRDLAREAGWTIPEKANETTTRLALFSDALSRFSDFPGGTVVVIEDLHWADDATVDFVRFIARRVVDHSLLFIVTFRNDDIDSQALARRALGEVPSSQLVRLVLSPLSRGAVASLCRETGHNPETVFQATAGNAFYVTELLRHAGDGPPLGVKDTVLAMADRLGSAGRDVLDIASIFPRAAEIKYLAAIADAEAETGIEDCLDRGLLESDGTSVSFRHELARQAVLASLRPGRRQSLNAILYRKLAAAGGEGPLRLLHHAREAKDAEAMCKLAPEAARAAAEVGSWREASACFDLAVETAGASADIELLEQAAWAKYLVGRHDIAVTYQRRAVELLAVGDDTLREGSGLRKYSRYLWGSADYTGAFEAAEAAVQKLAKHRGPELALAYSSVAQLHMLSYNYEAVEEPTRQAIEIAEEHDRPEIVSHALNNLAMSHLPWDHEQARGEMAQSLKIALEIGSIDNAARAYTNWSHMEYYACDFDAVRERINQALPFLQESELDGYHRYLVGLLARLNLRQGRWDEVVDPAMQSFGPEPILEVSNPHRFNGAIALMTIALRTGKDLVFPAEAFLRKFDCQNSEAQRLAPYAEIVAERAWITGESTDAAIALLWRAVSATPLPATIPYIYLWLRRFDALVDLPNTGHFPEPYRYELAGDWEAAADAWAQRNAPYDRALALAFGNDKACNTALEVLDALGATPVAARVRKVLQSRGKPVQRTGPRVSTLQNAAGLTRRQMDVLRLVAEGFTNNEIAQRLFVSPKTVDHHVSAILAKLDASTRGEATAVARKRNLIGS